MSHKLERNHRNMLLRTKKKKPTIKIMFHKNKKKKQKCCCSLDFVIIRLCYFVAKLKFSFSSSCVACFIAWKVDTSWPLLCTTDALQNLLLLPDLSLILKVIKVARKSLTNAQEWQPAASVQNFEQKKNKNQNWLQEPLIDGCCSCYCSYWNTMVASDCGRAATNQIIKKSFQRRCSICIVSLRFVQNRKDTTC